MQTNLNCNCPKPQFGMAFRKPEDMEALIKYANLGNPVNKRGLKQFIKELGELKHSDVIFDEKTNYAAIIDKATGKVVEDYESTPNQTGFDVYGAVLYPFRRIFGKIFNPKRNLPKNLYLAGEDAKKYEKMVNDNLKSRTSIDELF